MAGPAWVNDQLSSDVPRGRW